MLDLRKVAFDALGLQPIKGISAKGEVKVVCPYNSSRQVELNLHKNGFKCWSVCADCPADGKGGPISFAKLAFPNLADTKVAAKMYSLLDGCEWNPPQEVEFKEKKLSNKANLDVLNETYSNFLDKLVLLPEHRDDLIKRGLSLEDIRKIGFKSVPSEETTIAEELFFEGNILKGVPGFYFWYNKPSMSCHNMTGYFIPYRDEFDRIVALQIRSDIKITEDMTDEEISLAKKSRYRWFTSSTEETGCGASNVPFYGDIPENKEVVYLTEGGLKASVAQSLSKKWFTAIPGISCYPAVNQLFQYFEKVGVKKVVDAFDSDRAINPNVQNSIDNIKKIAQDYDFEFVSWSWGTKFKGVDDYLLSRKQEKRK